MSNIHRIAPSGRLVGELVQGRWSQGSLATTLARFAGRFGDWQDRARQRRHLAELDDRLLRDIGLSRADVEAERRKLPWQP